MGVGRRMSSMEIRRLLGIVGEKADLLKTVFWKVYIHRFVNSLLPPPFIKKKIRGMPKLVRYKQNVLSRNGRLRIRRQRRAVLYS